MLFVAGTNRLMLHVYVHTCMLLVAGADRLCTCISCWLLGCYVHVYVHVLVVGCWGVKYMCMYMC